MNNPKIFQIIFFLAGAYNLAFGIWLITFPASLFGLVDISRPYPEYLNLPLAIGIMAFVPGYFYASILIDKARPFIVLGLLAKLGTPFLVLTLVFLAKWPLELMKMVFFNDIIWWWPFLYFLRKKQTRIFA